jgi:hypothetical protein
MKIHEALETHPALLDDFIRDNPQGFNDDELALLDSWRYRVAGDFFIFRYLKKYTVFIGQKPERLYGVYGLLDPIENIFAMRPLPVMVKTVLYPFRDRITYHGLFSTYSVYFGGGIRADLNETYKRLKAREGIVEQLTAADGPDMALTSLAKAKQRTPPPDWRPTVDELVKQTEKMRAADTPEQQAAFGILRAAAKLAQTTLTASVDRDAQRKALRSLKTATTKLENLLYEDWQ